jgi:hypothetical protein
VGGADEAGTGRVILALDERHDGGEMVRLEGVTRAEDSTRDE